MRHPLRFAPAVLGACFALACATTKDVTPTASSPVASDSAANAAPSPLLGTTWRLVTIDGREALSGVRVTAVFDADNRVAGSAGCNHYFGSAAAKSDRLEVGGLGSTRMFCGADGVMDQESAYLAALGKATAYRVTGRELQLSPASGAATLVFEAE